MIAHGNGNIQVGGVVNGSVIAGGRTVISGDKLSDNDIVIGCGEIKKKEIPLSIISPVRLITEIPADLTVVCGTDKPGLSITAEENITPFISVETTENRLVLSAAKSFSTTQPISLELKIPSLIYFCQGGMGGTHIKGMNSDNLAINHLGVGNVYLEGFVGCLDVFLKGTGDIDAKGLKAKKASLSLKGVGTISAFVTGEVVATLEGVGDIRLFGNPPKVSSSCRGVGNIQTL